MKYLITVFVLLLSQSAVADYYPTPEYRIFGEPNSESDKKAIDQLIEQFREAWANREAAAVAKLHSLDVEWVNAFGRTFRGANELEDFLANRLLPGFAPQVWQEAMRRYRPISRRYLGSDTAIISALTQSGPGSAAGDAGRRVSFVFVLNKQGGKWRIVHQTISDIRERRNSND